MARPKKELNFDTLDKLLEIHCTERECAHFFETSEDTIDRRVKEEYGIGFAEYKSQKEAIGKTHLRRKQFELAMKGNIALLIFLGKNMLNQKDKVEKEVEIRKSPEAQKLEDMTLSELIVYIQTKNRERFSAETKNLNPEAPILSSGH